MRIDYNEIVLWVMNTPSLYSWWRAERICMSRFVRLHWKELANYIRENV